MIYGNNTFKNRNEKTSYAAHRILSLVCENREIRSAVDVGCGVGTFLNALQELGKCQNISVLGLDGDYVDKTLLVIPQNNFISCDLEKPLSLNQKYDLVISLEVAEHLSPQRAESFIDDLTALGDCILFSAAIPYQGGQGHINEQYLSYWNNLFRKKGYSLIDCIRPVIWNDANIPWHYRQNTVLFVRNHFLSEEYNYVDLIHPAFWENKNERLNALENKLIVKVGSYINQEMRKLKKFLRKE